MEEIASIVLELIKDEFTVKNKLGENHVSIMYEIIDKKGFIKFLRIDKWEKHSYLDDINLKHSSDWFQMVLDEYRNRKQDPWRTGIIWSFRKCDICIFNYMPSLRVTLL